MSEIIHRYQPGDRVRVAPTFGYPATDGRGGVAAVAVIRKTRPYRGFPGYDYDWDYGRQRAQFESAGGWMHEPMIVGPEFNVPEPDWACPSNVRDCVPEVCRHVAPPEVFP